MKRYTPTTRAQRESIFRLWCRAVHPDMNDRPSTIRYKDFRRQVEPGYGFIGIVWRGIFYGIEPDGYTHT